ncbi:hypothetical protein HYR54_06290 [Candidatus Acetothermia bacterium]|nr:hypothetical protein [Candidatus Acetothermia bacterium]
MAHGASISSVAQTPSQGAKTFFCGVHAGANVAIFILRQTVVRSAISGKLATFFDPPTVKILELSFAGTAVRIGDQSTGELAFSIEGPATGHFEADTTIMEIDFKLALTLTNFPSLLPSKFNVKFRGKLDLRTKAVLGNITGTVPIGTPVLGEAELIMPIYCTPGPPRPVDAFFLVDLSGSYSNKLAAFKNHARRIVNDLTSLGVNARFGLGTFVAYKDFGASGICPDCPYSRIQDLTSDQALILSKINGLSTIGREGEQLETQLTALFQAATGAGQPEQGIPAGLSASFRVGISALHIVILYTDEAFTLKGQFRGANDAPNNFPGPDFPEVLSALNSSAEGIKVIGILGREPDRPDITALGLADLQTVALGTSTFAPTDGVDCDGDGLVAPSSDDLAGGMAWVCFLSPSGAGVAQAIIAAALP